MSVMGPLGGTDLCFSGPHTDTSSHCETTDTVLVQRVGWSVHSQTFFPVLFCLCPNDLQGEFTQLTDRLLITVLYCEFDIQT